MRFKEGYDHLQGTLKKLHLAAHANIIAFIKTKWLIFRYVPEPGVNRAGAIPQFHEEVGITLPICLDLLLDDQKYVVHVVAIVELVNESSAHSRLKIAFRASCNRGMAFINQLKS